MAISEVRASTALLSLLGYGDEGCESFVGYETSIGGLKAKGDTSKRGNIGMARKEAEGRIAKAMERGAGKTKFGEVTKEVRSFWNEQTRKQKLGKYEQQRKARALKKSMKGKRASAATFMAAANSPGNIAGQPGSTGLGGFPKKPRTKRTRKPRK